MVKLTPLIDPTVREFIEKRETLESLTTGFGTPLNILFPENLSSNIKAFDAVFKRNHLNGKIYYAHKANKSKALVNQAKYEGILIDVASEKELQDALISGFGGNQIEVTGPKNQSFILLAIQHNCLIQIDNFDELDQIISLYKKIKHDVQVNVLIRFSGFSSSATRVASKDSRFGIALANKKKVIDVLIANKEIFNFKGFSYHLDSNTPKEKSIALENLMHLFEVFQASELTPSIINIGGGFKINYIASEKEWNNFLTSLQQAALGNIPSITWNNTNFGFVKVENRVRGSSNFYEYFTKVAGAEYLNEILSVKLHTLDNVTAAQMMSELMLQFFIEPGRALLDQTGITIAKVTFVKESTQGEILVGLDMNRSNLASTDQEMMLDPIILYKNRNKTDKPNFAPPSPKATAGYSEASLGKPHGVYFVGNLCLETDFIYKHKTFLDQLPQADDLVIFVNTAAYNMDFTESETIQQKTAKKIAVVKRNNKFLWFEDEQYNPYLLEEQL